MHSELLKSKLHRVTVTQCDLHYVGFVTIDKNLMDDVNLVASEKVGIVNINTGNRFNIRH